jgi:hypothetical protein
VFWPRAAMASACRLLARRLFRQCAAPASPAVVWRVLPEVALYSHKPQRRWKARQSGALPLRSLAPMAASPAGSGGNLSPGPRSLSIFCGSPNAS